MSKKRKSPVLGVERTAFYDIIAGDVNELLDVSRIREANMNRNRKPMGRKKCLKMMGVLLASAMVTAGTGGQAVYASGQDSHIEKSDKENKEEHVIYLNGESGSDSNSGTSAKRAVKTFRKAASLAGKEGKILICGTVTVEGEETWELPDGVSIRAAEGFSDPLVCVTGSLTLENIWITESQITGDGEVEGAVRESLVKVPEVISIEQPCPLSEISLEECEGQGTFSWENEDAVPSAWETVYQVIFRPEDPDAEDYSQEEGWVEESGVVIRQVTVRVLSLEEAGEDGADQETSETPEDGGSQGESGTGEVPDSSGEGNTGSEAGEASDAGEDTGSGTEEMPDAGAGSGSETGETPDAGAGSGSETGETPDAGAGSGSETGETPDAGAGSGSETEETPDTGASNGSGTEETPDTGDSGNENGEFPEEGTDGDNSGNQAPDAGESGSGQEQPGTGETPGDGNQTPENGGQDETDEGDPATGGEDGSAAGEGEESEDSDVPEDGSAQQPGDGTENPDAGSQTPDTGTAPSGDETAGEAGGLTGEEQQQAADVQALLDALPEQAASLDDVNLVVEATRAYLSLNDASRETLNAESVRHLEALQQQSAALNRTSGGVTIEGDFPWYVQFRAQYYSQEDQLTLPQNSGADTVIAPYDMLLWDLMNQQEYHLKGQQVRITMPAPDMNMFSQLVVLHYLEDGSVEYITPVNNGNGTISFLTTSFSPYNLAGSQVLVGNTNWLYTPAATGGNSSGSSGSTQTSQSGTSSSGRSGSQGSGSQTQTLTGSVSQAVSSGSQSSSRVNRVAATNDPQNPLLYAGIGAAALIILAGAAVGAKKTAARRKESENTKE